MTTNHLPLRIGAVSYLNTKPLVFGMEPRAADWELTLDLPSRLADGLAAGNYDVALIPSVEYFQHPGYGIVSDACIACRGPVWSVKLLSRVPFGEIRTLALDEGSRTSAALVKILLENRCGVRPTTSPLPIGVEASEVTTDAILLIGDRAMHPFPGEFTQVWDLGEEWCRWTGLPFVFAMWVARDLARVESWRGGALAGILGEARDAGLANLEAISATAGPAAGLAPAACLSYLRDNLYFHLGPLERQGLELFRGYVTQAGLARPQSAVDRKTRPVAMAVGPEAN